MSPHLTSAASFILVGLAACDAPELRLPEVQLQFATLHEAVAKGRLHAIEDGGVPSLLMNSTRVGFEEQDGRSVVGIHARDLDAVLSVESMGRDILVRLPAGTPDVLGPRVAINRGLLTEWYLNTEKGVEQGFSVADRPPGPGPLRIRMTLEGDLRAIGGGDGVQLVDHKSTLRYRYDHLVAEGANGEALPAYLTSSCEDGVDLCQIELVVDDTKATYPLYIDPLLAENPVDIDIAAATANLGHQVALQGDWAVVSAPNGTAGTVFIVERNVGNPDNWGLEHTITNTLDSFGETVALDFPYLAVGAPASNSVVLYEYRNNSWDVIQTLAGTVLGSGFGTGLDLQSPYLGVGAPEAGIGSVAIYLVVDGTFEKLTTPSIVPIGAAAGDRLGARVRLRFPLVIAGVPGFAGGDGAVIIADALTGMIRSTLSGGASSGEAYGSSFDATADLLAVGTGDRIETFSFEREIAGAYQITPGQVLLSPAVAGADFANSIAALDDTLVAGDAGAPAMAHVFARQGGSWFHSQSLEVAESNGTTPVSVDLNSRTIVAGSASQGVGGAKLWNRQADDLVQVKELTNTDPNARAGRAVAVNGQFAVVGDPLAPTSNGGRVDVYQDTDAGWSHQAGLVPSIDPTSDNEFGHAVDLDGEVLIVGSPEYGGVGAFTSYALEGSDWTSKGRIVGSVTGGRFGVSVAIDGQLIAIGEPSVFPGTVYIYAVQEDLSVISTGAVAVGSTIGQGAGASSQYGFSVDVQGDLIAVGARGWDSVTQSDAGKVDVLQHVVGGAPNPIATMEGIDADDRCGTDVFLAADRLAVACHSNGVLAGKALIYRGDLDGYALEARIDGGAPSHNFGTSIALVEDRVLVGAKGLATVRTYQRNADGEDQWGPDTSLDLSGPAGSLFGEAIDVDGTRIIVGAAKNGTGTATIFQFDADIPRYSTDDAAVVNEDSSVSIDFTANDWDGDGGVITTANLAASVVVSPTKGQLNLVDLNYVYTPDPDEFGADGFTYTIGGNSAVVTITINPVNDLPIGQPDTYNAIEEVLLTAPTVLSNDSDVEDTLLIAVLATSPQHAAAFTFNSDGTFTYEGELNYAGADSFTYMAVDTEGGQSVPIDVTINIEDTPESPILVDSFWETPQNTSLLVAVPGLSGDDFAELPGAGTLFSALDTGSLDGTVLVLANGSFSFVPTIGFTGTTSFTILADFQGATDTAVVTIDVGVGSSQPPLPQPDAYSTREDETLLVGSLGGVLANDVDLDGDPLSATFEQATIGQFLNTSPNGSFEWVPPANYTGQATLTYTVSDGIENVTGVPITITVSPVNDTPVAVPDTFSFAGPGPHEVLAADGLLLNDSDIDGDTLAAILVRNPSSGTLEVGSDGALLFSPRIGFEGAQTAEYIVTDGIATSLKAVIELSVSNNAQPAADTSDTGTTSEDTAATCVDVFFPDQDGDGFANEEATARVACDAPEGFTAELGDCDDTRADIYPGAPETQGDGIDQDCDGLDADIKPRGSCSSAPTSPMWFAVFIGLAATRRRSC